MCAASPARADSGELLDPDQDELIVPLAHRKLHAVARPRVDRIEERWTSGDRHQLHGFHAERRHGLVAHEEYVRGRARDDRPTNLIGCGTDDRSPDARSERREQNDKEKGGYGTV